MKYTFYLIDGSRSREVHPIWKDDLALEYAYESRQMFMRAGLSGQLTFVAGDYDFIMATNFENKITLRIMVAWNEGDTAVQYWQGMFHLTDCTIHTDDKKIVVKPQIEDRYNKILAGLEKEYDLIKLTPAIQPVQMHRRPMLQIYSLGDSIVSCFLSSMSWEQEANVCDDGNELIEDYHFAQISGNVEITLSGTGMPSELGGTWIGSWYYGGQEGEWDAFSNGDSTYKMKYFQEKVIDTQTQNITYRHGIRIYASSDQSTILYEFMDSRVNSGWPAMPLSFTLVSKRTGYNDLSASAIDTSIFGRWCVASENEYEIPADDIVTYNRNYRYCTPCTLTNIVRMTYNYSSTPTEYGLRTDGTTYYAKPNAELGVYNFLPISRSTWGGASLWYTQRAETEAIENAFTIEHELRDAFTLEASINALLAEIDPSISFDASSTYSQFLYGTISMAYMSSLDGRLLLTPKSNILVAEYTQPARKAPIRLSEIFNMLRDSLGCYWFIDDSNRLRIEHLYWFKNGGSYSQSPSVGINLTTMINPRNGKPWSYETGTYQYDKIQMPARYEFAWMDDTTEVFKGDAIDIVSTYVQEDNIEDISIAKFNPDVDYMMLNPNNVSEDGFALLCAHISGGVYTIPIYNLIVHSTRTIIQNPSMAIYNLERQYLIWDMPSWYIKIYGSATTSKGIQRMKQQQVSIPLGFSDPDMKQLVTTSLGNGQIKKMTIQLTTRMAKTDLVYDTTQQ